MRVICLDLEGVLVPEIWIGLAERTGIDDLRVTTREVADYDELMRHRLAVLDREGLGMRDVQAVIDGLEPLPGAIEFLDGLREAHQVIILSDTFYPFAGPLMRRLGNPTLFAHDLAISSQGKITGYRLRIPDQKTAGVRALQSLNFQVIASGDSRNDTGMLAQADRGIFFRPPQELVAERPEFPVAHDYGELAELIAMAEDELDTR